MPSVLIELDFICNPGAAKYMTSEKGQKELASAIFKAIEKYEKIWQKSKKSSGGKRLSSSEANEDLESFDDATLEASASSASVVVTKSSPSSSKRKWPPRRQARSLQEEIMRRQEGEGVQKTGGQCLIKRTMKHR